MNESQSKSISASHHQKWRLRNKLRKYKRLCWMCSILTLVSGILIGFVVGAVITTPSTTDDGFPNSATAIPVVVSETKYNLGTTYTFTTDVRKDGDAAYVDQRPNMMPLHFQYR